jgi:hypothetical protein
MESIACELNISICSMDDSESGEAIYKHLALTLILSEYVDINYLK